MFRKLFSNLLRNLLNRCEPKSTALVPVYTHNGTFTRVVEHGSEIVRFYNYHCRCGQDTPLTVSEARTTKMQQCGCSKPFNLLRSLDLIEADGRLKAEYEYALTRLPVRALAVQQPRRPAAQFVDWGYETAGEVTWTGSAPASGVIWK